MAPIRTTRGEVDDANLARTVGVEDRPDQIAVWVEWRLVGELVRRDAFPLPKETGPMVYTIRGEVPYAQLRRVVELSDTPTEIAVAVRWHAADGELVRRDAHVILKEASVTADALAASLG